MRTTNKSIMPYKVIMTDRAINRSSVRIAIYNPISCSYSFIINERLHLPESPLMNPLIISTFAPPNVCQIFHHNGCSCWNTLNDSLAYIMVSPHHKPSPSARQSFKMPSSRLRAFGLKFTNQFIMLDSERFNLFSKEEFIRCNCKVIYSEINPKNSVLETRAFRIDVFGEREQEEASAFFINSKETLFDIPSEIFFVTGWNSEWNFNSAFNCSQRQNIILEGCRTREVVSHRTSSYDRFGLGFLYHLTSLSDTTNSELCLETFAFEVSINNSLQFELVSYLIFPTPINTILQTFSINFDSLDYFRFNRNFNFSGCSCLHNIEEEQQIYKTFYQESMTEETDMAIPPLFKNRGALAYAL